MRHLLFFIATFFLALAQISVWPGLHLLLLLLVGLVVFVDVVVGTIFALVAGLLLDLLGVHYLGFSTTVIFLGCAGAVETVKLSIRSAPDHPVALHVLACAFLILVVAASLADVGPVKALKTLLLHLSVAFLLVPVLLPLGAEYQRDLRERGYL